jgi:hypothetical protein
MVYINTNTDNEFVLNINNNVRDFPGGSNPDIISFNFTHVLSNDKRFTTCFVNPDPITPFVPPVGDFYCATNDRYTEFFMIKALAQGMMIYDGEYEVLIRNSDLVPLYKGIWQVTGNSVVEENPFIEYQSDNEENNSYIYIEE